MEKNNQERARVVHQVKPIPAATPRRERVAAYCRVSSGKDAMLHSLSAQVSHYSTYIQKHPGWEYAGVYADATVIIGLKQNPTNGRRFSPIFLLYRAFCGAKHRMPL